MNIQGPSHTVAVEHPQIVVGVRVAGVAALLEMLESFRVVGRRWRHVGPVGVTRWVERKGTEAVVGRGEVGL